MSPIGKKKTGGSLEFPKWLRPVIMALALALALAGSTYEQEKMLDINTLIGTPIGIKSCEPFDVGVVGFDTPESLKVNQYAVVGYFRLDGSNRQDVPYALVLTDSYTGQGAWLYFDYDRNGYVSEGKPLSDYTGDETDICLTALKVNQGTRTAGR